jgi:DHA3 family tetracycline resistance protein-like MFS transporter
LPSWPSSRLPRILEPLRIRDFRLLWCGLAISLLGDGFYLVAIAWQVYELSDAPTALALVGVCLTVPQVAFVLVGGVITDRLERRRVLLAADIVRGIAVGTVGVLAVSGHLELWHLFVLAAVFGVGSALFGPAFSAIVPELVPDELILQANSLERFVRPLAIRFVGPALGGIVVASFGAGTAFILDGLSFGASVAALLAIRHRPALVAPDRRKSLLRDVGEGLGFVRSQPWLLGTIVATSIGMLFFLGPVYVLLPLVVKQSLGGTATDLGLVFAAGGVGAMIASFVLAGRGLPRRPLTVMYACWAAMCLQLVGYAVARSVWPVVVVAMLGTALLVYGQILWTTMLQRLVPRPLLGRVASVDSLLSWGLTPVSYALTAPVVRALGMNATLAGAGLAAAAVLVVTWLAFPRIRAVEEAPEETVAAAEPAVRAG